MSLEDFFYSNNSTNSTHSSDNITLIIDNIEQEHKNQFLYI